MEESGVQRADIGSPQISGQLLLHFDVGYDESLKFFHVA
jgi:hypothetical protein